MLDMVMRSVVQKWCSYGYGVKLDSETIQYQAWADDIVLYASCLSHLRHMFELLTLELGAHGMGVKPGSTEALSSTGEWSSETLEWEVGGKLHIIECKHVLSILGVSIDSRGSSAAAVKGRVQAAWTHWFAREKVFRDNRLPLRARWLRLRKTPSSAPSCMVLARGIWTIP
jgi:hypothetical protein